MKIVINGETAEIPSGGGSGGVTMDQVNDAIDTKLDAYEPQEVYSTEETRIGTWIDGKPIYQKTCVGTTVSNGDIKLIPNVDSIIGTKGFVALNVSGNKKMNIPWSLNANDQVNALVTTDDYATLRTYGGSWAIKHFEIVFEYTKTTDQATASALSDTVVSKNNADFALNLPQQSVSFSPVTVSNIAEEEE